MLVFYAKRLKGRSQEDVDLKARCAGKSGGVFVSANGR